MKILVTIIDFYKYLDTSVSLLDTRVPHDIVSCSELMYDAHQTNHGLNGSLCRS